MNRRGVWELSTPRLEQLLATLARSRGEPITAIGLQQEGFDAGVCGGLAGLSGTAASIVVESVPPSVRSAHAPSSSSYGPAARAARPCLVTPARCCLSCSAAPSAA